LVRLGWLTAAFSVAVIGWMLLPGDRLLPWVVSAPSTVYAALYPSHPNGSPRIVSGHYVIEVKNRQFVPVSRQVYLDTVESSQRGSVGVALLLNLIALMGLAHADESRTPARNVRLPLLGEQRWPWVRCGREEFHG
jgi:hypothetical protein